MSATGKELFPLSKTTHHDLVNLCEALFGWRPCAEWIATGKCEATDGPASHLHPNLQAFFNHCKYVTANYLPEVVGSSNAALKSHGDLLNIVKFVRDRPQIARSALASDYFHQKTKLTGQDAPSLADQEQALNIAVRIMVMVLPSAENQSDGLLEAGLQPTIWTNEQSLRQLISSSFPQREHPLLNQSGEFVAMAKVRLASITARRLQNLARLEIIPTSDMRNHLLLDEKGGEIAVFHFTSFLKENLSVGAIPSALVLETLVTIKEILFSNDAHSHPMLLNLVSKKGFDPDILRIVDSPQYVAAVRKPINYVYWGTRLMELHDELENPTPRGFMETWLERKSGARYMMLATIAGLAFAILLGIVGVGLSAFQAWIGWQQWKHPVQ